MEAFKTLSKHVQEQEPKTQIYFALQPPKSQELIIVEKYDSLGLSFSLSLSIYLSPYISVITAKMAITLSPPANSIPSWRTDTQTSTT